MQVVSQPPTLDPANGRDLNILRFPEQECGNTVGFPFHISDQPGHGCVHMKTVMWAMNLEFSPPRRCPEPFVSNFHRAKKSGHTIIRASKLRFLT